MLVAKTNVSSLIAQRHLNSTNRSLQGHMAKLSSGFRINTAADDAAGLAVSEEMKADIRSLNQASRNANDAISVVQTAEGALGEMQNILIRMRELSVQANNGSLSGEQRGHIQTEFNELTREIDDIAKRTTFNGVALFDGTSMAFQVGVEATDLIVMNVGSISASALSLGTGSLSASEIIQVSLGAVVATLGTLDTAISTISAARATLGAQQNRVEMKLENLAVYRENLEAANSRIRDVDFAAEMANMTKSQILLQSGTAMLAQANAMPQAILGLLR